MTAFELEAIGGPLARRLARRRGDADALDWSEVAAHRGTELGERARLVWTQSAFSEYASAASFAAMSAGLLAVGAPIDLTAAAADFVVDELVHAELAARAAMALGGAVALDVDLERLVRPPAAAASLVRTAELVVRTSCVGESMTVALLLAAKEHAGSAVLSDVIGRIARDEAEHAELGWWFLDWAEPQLGDAERRVLGDAATAAVGSFARVFGDGCAGESGLGVLACATYDATFLATLRRRVLDPLAERGISVDESAIRAVEAAIG